MNQSDLSRSPDFDLKDELLKYVRFWPWFVLSLILSLVTTFIYLRYTPNVYATQGKIKVLSTDDSMSIPELSRVSFFRGSNINLDNEIQLLSSYQMAEQVVRELGLTESLWKQGRIVNTEIFNSPFEIKRNIPIDSITDVSIYEIVFGEDDFSISNEAGSASQSFSGLTTMGVEHDFPFDIIIPEDQQARLDGDSYQLIISPLKRSARGIQARTSIKRPGDQSDILLVEYQGESQEKSEAIVNTLMKIFNEDGKEDKRRVHLRTIEFIDERFVTLIEELDTIEGDKQQFKQENNFIDLQANAAVDLQRGTEVDRAVFDVESQVLLAETLVKTLRETSGTELLPANIGITDISINDQIDSYNQAVLRRDRLATAGGSNNPSVQLLDATINDYRTSLDRSLEAYIAQLNISKELIAKRSSEVKTELSSIPLKEKVLRDIERKQKIKEELYLYLLEKREIAAISYAVTDDVTKIIDYAITKGNPVKPKRKLFYLGSLIVGLLVPFGVLYVLFLLDTKVHRKKDLEDVIDDVVVVGEIPQISRSEDHVFTNPNQRTVVAEASRIISSNIDYLLPEKQPGRGQVVLTTSTIKGEGKTFTALNYSLAMASIRKKVLLIGADLRNPQLHTYINVAKNVPGLSNYLNDSDQDWRSFLLKGFNEFPTHDILLAGALPPNPVQLLSNGNLDKLVEEARREYDFIVIDAAPTILVTDTLVISHLADATVYLTRANHTERELLKWCRDLIKQGKLKNVGFVINGLGAGSRKGYAYRYSYNYGYRYGYGSSKK